MYPCLCCFWLRGRLFWLRGRQELQDLWCYGRLGCRQDWPRWYTPCWCRRHTCYLLLPVQQARLHDVPSDAALLSLVSFSNTQTKKTCGKKNFPFCRHIRKKTPPICRDKFGRFDISVVVWWSTWCRSVMIDSRYLFFYVFDLSDYTYIVYIPIYPFILGHTED